MTNDGTIPEILTFDNMMLLPGRSSVLPRDVNLTMRLTQDLTMNIPLLSAAMDTVTEARLAIAPAQEGGGAARGVLRVPDPARVAGEGSKWRRGGVCQRPSAPGLHDESGG